MPLDEIYALKCPDSGEIRYIGKARDSQKRLKSHLRDCRRRKTPVYCWIKSLFDKSKVPVLEVLLVTWNWRESEKEIIAQYRKAGFRLLNLADGGEQPLCPQKVRAENGRKVAKNLHSDPRRKKIWELKKSLGDLLRRNYVNNRTREKLRWLARKYPDDFGNWANIKDRVES